MASGRRVLVTGGAGYVGCILVPRLLGAGHEVVVYDIMLFGADGLGSFDSARGLDVVEADIRDIDALSKALAGATDVIHLAALSNDPSFELDPNLSRAINYDAFGPMMGAVKDAGVGRFIYASTSSVYGVSEADEVTEEHPLVPLTDYNKYKGLAEPIVLAAQSSDLTTVVIRPATVCGYSPRMRLDLTVNILTSKAVTQGVITVFGGSQKRPNIHIDDVAGLYVELLDMPTELIAGETFNAGYENYTVAELAAMVKRVVEDELPDRGPIRIETTASNDLRSYHVSSRKIAERLGWTPKRSLEDAVRDLCRAFTDGRLSVDIDDDRFHNVRTVKKAGLA